MCTNNQNIPTDCEVTHIDERPSMEVIKEFADTINDAGVRFNSALTVLTINEKSDRVNSIDSHLGKTFLRNHR